MENHTTTGKKNPDTSFERVNYGANSAGDLRTWVDDG